jgi:hypothetical protein
MNWTVIAAVNNERVLKSCLLNSPDVSSASEIILQSGYPSAAAAYNQAIDKAQSEILVFVHQDVYLPAGWLASLEKSVAELSNKDPQWAVAGVWGIQRSGERNGYVYCAGLCRKLGSDFERPVEVRTLDELLLVVRKSSGVRFDEKVPGFHMYGTDICLEAQRQGMRSYAISAFCIHNTNGYGMLPWQFWRCYFQMRRKWRSQLPVITPCAEITFWCWPMIRWNLVQAANIVLGRHKPGRRVLNPNQLFQELNSGSITR